jgi:hypothetical protein
MEIVSSTTGHSLGWTRPISAGLTRRAEYLAGAGDDGERPEYCFAMESTLHLMEFLDVTPKGGTRLIGS